MVTETEKYYQMGTRYLSDDAASILRTLTYFDIFQYPISKEEICLFMDRSMNDAVFYQTIDDLVKKELVFKIKNFYSLHDDPSLIIRREAGNQRAETLLQTAYRISLFLYKFPFVRGIGISGSLSKNFADENADIDFFVITASNRLWIARTCMHLYKQITYINGKWRWYCMNYFIDEEALLIGEQNIFTATEIATVIPVCGNEVFQNFFNANSWSSDYYPNQDINKECKKTVTRNFWVKRLAEFLLNNVMGNKLDNYLMEFTRKRAKRKEDKLIALTNKANARGFKTTKHCARPHPECFQKRIVDLYESRLSELEQKWYINFKEKVSKRALIASS